MLVKQILDFLNHLSVNNNKPWFDENRATYETLRNAWNVQVKQLIAALAELDPELGYLEPKDCTFRINRDVRFSADKSPYKTNMGAYIAKGGKKSKFGGYYVHLEPKECFIAAGVWMPEPENLYKIRQEIDYKWDAFKQVIQQPDFKKTFGELSGEKVKNVPKNFYPESEAAEYLKYKSYTVSRKIDLNELKDENLVQNLKNHFGVAAPFVNFLNKALED